MLLQLYTFSFKKATDSRVCMIQSQIRVVLFSLIPIIQYQLTLLMILKTLRLLHRTSSRKFFEIVAQKQQTLLPTSPEQFIISKYLKEQRNIYQNKTKVQQTKGSQSNKRNVDYQQILQNNPHGSILQQSYKNLQLNLISFNYKNIQLKDVYDVCQKFNPDLVIVQGKPEYYLPNFELLPKRKDIFSDQLYLKQLIMQSEMSKNLLSNDINDYFHNLVEEKQTNKDEKIYIQDTRGPVEDEVVLMGTYFSTINRKDLLMGQIPEQPWRQWLCNSHTLMELQQLFKHLCKNIPYYQSLNLSLEKLAHLLKPELFLNLKDRYLATVIEMLVAQGKYNRVMAIMGPTQNEAVWDILSNKKLLKPTSHSRMQEFTPIIEYLVGPQIKSSIIRNVGGWQVIEKHILLDILKYGPNIVNIPVDEFTVTNRVIEHYGMMVNSYSKQNIMRFRFDKTMEYISLMQRQIEEGKELKKKFMLREAIRRQQEEEEY